MSFASSGKSTALFAHGSFLYYFLGRRFADFSYQIGAGAWAGKSMH